MNSYSSTLSDRQAAHLACEVDATLSRPAARPFGVVFPNALVRWAFALSVFVIPFSSLYVPGTGDKIGVLRLVQLLIACAVLSQPRVCLRWIPTALFWFWGYIMLRIVWGFWLTPELDADWWPDSRVFITLLLWGWLMFNVLQFPEMRRHCLWALGCGCFLCALFHVAGIGVEQVADDDENRSSVFGMQANELGATYATAMIALLGLWMTGARRWTGRILPFPMMAIIGLAMAKTGSRMSLIILAIGSLVLFFFGESMGSRMKRILGVLALVFVLAAILWQVPTAMSRFLEINTKNIGENNPRARMAPVLWEMFLRSPIYGLGPNGYRWELTRRAMPYLVNQGKLIVAHNQILLLLVETGIIGFAIYSAGVISVLKAGWRARHKSCGPLPLALFLPYVIVAATVAHPASFLILWLALAYCLAGAAKIA